MRPAARALSVSYTAGTADLELVGELRSYQSLFSGYGATAPFEYVIEPLGEDAYEEGVGRLVAGSPPRLQRLVPTSSSNGGALVDFIQGEKRIFGTFGTLSAAAAMLIKSPCRVMSRVNVTLATALNVGDAVDGVTLVLGDRVFLAAQTAPAENGPWQVTGAGAPIRPPDFLAGDSARGAWVSVMEGTAWGGSSYICTSAAGSDVVGTHGLTWKELLPTHTHAIADVMLLQAALDAKQPLDATLTALAGVTTAANQLIYSTALDTFTTTTLSAFGRSLIDDADATAARTTLGLGTAATFASTAFQASDATLTALAGVTTAANTLIYATGVDAFTTASLTTFGRSLIDDADATAARTTLGLGTAATSASTAFQAADATLTALAGVTTAADTLIYATGVDAFTTTSLTTFGRSLIDDADATAARTTLGLGTAATSASTAFQAADATLTALAGVTTAANTLIYATGVDAFTTTSLTAFGRSLIDDADATAARTTLGLGTAATSASTAFQAVDATLTALAGVTTAADTLIYATAADTFTTTTLSAFARTLIDDADAAATRTTLGVGAGDSPSWYSATFTGGVNAAKNLQVTNTSTGLSASSGVNATCGAHSANLAVNSIGNTFLNASSGGLFLRVNGIDSGAFSSQLWSLPDRGSDPALVANRSLIWSDTSGRPKVSYGTNGIIDLAANSRLTPTALKTANYTAAPGELVLVRAPGTNTAGAAGTFTTLTVTLPASPVVGDQVAVYVAESYRCGIVLIARNGQLIDGGTAVSQFVLSQVGECYLFNYTGSTYGWQAEPIHSRVPRRAYYSQAAGNLTLATNWATLHNSTLSFAAWVKTPVATGTQYVMRCSNPSSPFQGWEVTIDAGILKFYDGGTSRTSGFNVADNSWHHIAVVYVAGSSVSFYVDGVFITFTTASVFTSYAGDKFIGASSGGASRLYGSFDDLRVYYGALNDDDIDLLFNGGNGTLSEATSVKANLSSWFRYDGTNYYDFARGYAATVSGTLKSPVVSALQAY